MINHLISIFGERGVSISDIDKLAYSTDGSRIREEPIAVVWPENEEQLRRLFRYATRVSVNIVPRGGGSGLRGGCIGKKAIIIDMSKWNKIVKVNVLEKWVEVQAGVVLDDLNNLLKQYNLFFPVIPHNHGVSTFGGLVSTDSIGIRSGKYGRVSDHVMSIDFVDGGGKIITVKDSNLCGTEGNCGIIMSVKIKVEKIPDPCSVSVFIFDAALDLSEKLKELEFNKNVVAVEFIDKKISDMLGFENKHQLIVEYSSDEGEIKASEEIEKIWAIRDSVYNLLVSKGYSILEDPKVPTKKVPEFIVWLVKNKIPVFGSPLLGMMHPIFRKKQEWLIKQMYTQAKSLGGNLCGSFGIGLLKKDVADLKELDRIRALKKIYDSEDVMNKGKLE